ncbi:MAG: pentapeptide repeat-containing protein [Pseudomonadota bacterium]
MADRGSILVYSIIHKACKRFACASLTILFASTAYAACTDAPGPGVQWRRCLLDGIELQRLDLSGAVLRDASFKRSNLAGSDLSDVDARRAKFVTTELQATNLDNANLELADFTRANLADATLVNASLRRARFFRANLAGADLTGAIIVGADLLHADLTGATWIDGLTVCGPGSLGTCRASQDPQVDTPTR